KKDLRLRVVNLDRRRVVNLLRRTPDNPSGEGWSIYIGDDWSIRLVFPMLNQQLLETAQYTPGADPSLSPALIEISTAVLLPRDHRRDTMQEVFSIARSKQALLHEYVIAQNYALYSAPASKRVSGFRIVSTSL
ncbi:MAG: hypothetical protein NTX43_08860, partial [Bacteroidetes bacterium]|nr:hypothetical protein [Bacteroidota bacterium]